MSVNSKIYNTYMQFGFLYITKGFFKRLIAPIVKMTTFYILVIEDHIPTSNTEEIKVLDSNNIDAFLNSGFELSKHLKRQLVSFLPKNSIAVLVIRDGQVAAWGFIQQSGLSKYAGYDYDIPNSFHLLKNLFVEPAFRGQSIGKLINEARINCIPEKSYPTVFVIPSNKFAIRNLEMYGFRKQVFVKDYLWFNKYHARSLKALSENEISNTIISGFKDE